MKQFNNEWIKFKNLQLLKLDGMLKYSTLINLKSNINNFTKEFYNSLAFLIGNKLKKALKEINICIEENKLNIDAIILRAKIYFKMEKKKKAFKDIWYGFKLEPNNQEILEYLKNDIDIIKNYKNQCYENLYLGDLKKSENFCNKGWDINNFDIDLLIVKNYILRLNNKYKEALDLIKNIKNYMIWNKIAVNDDINKLDNCISLTYNNMGKEKFENKNYELSKMYFLKAYKIRKQDFGILINLGDLNLKLNNYDNSHKYYLEAYKLVKNYKNEYNKNYFIGLVKLRISNFYYFNAIYFYNSKNFNNSLKLINQSIEYNYNLINVKLKIKIWYNLNEFSSSKILLEELFTKFPNDINLIKIKENNKINNLN